MRSRREGGGLYRYFSYRARDEAGLGVILDHEVAHALLRHSGERMTQTQILGTGLALAGAGGVNPQILQALGLGASVVEQQNGERAVAEALAYKLRLNLLTIVNERQRSRSAMVNTPR